MEGKIWEKDDFFLNSGMRHDMDPAVVKLPDDGVPVTWQFNYDQKPIGKATNIRLVDGEIVGEIEFFELEWNKDLEELTRFGGYYTDVTKTAAVEEPRSWIIKSCTLRAVGVVFKDGMPGYPKKE